MYNEVDKSVAKITDSIKQYDPIRCFELVRLLWFWHGVMIQIRKGYQAPPSLLFAPERSQRFYWHTKFLHIIIAPQFLGYNYSFLLKWVCIYTKSIRKTLREPTGANEVIIAKGLLVLVKI